MFEPVSHHLYLKDMNDAAYVQRYCRLKNIYFMVYSIKWKDEILKYGIQHSIGGSDPGERLYTQVGWMPGWEGGTLKRSRKTGEAIQKLIQHIEQTYKTAFHKDDVTVEIMDYTNYKFFNKDNRYAEMQNFEEHHKNLFYETKKYFPIGNPKQEKIRLLPTQFNNLFDYG